MDKKEIKSLEKKFEKNCFCCSVVDLDKGKTPNCAECEAFKKEDALILLNEFYRSRKKASKKSAKLGLPEDVLERIFELHFQSVPKYSIVKTINSEFPRIVNGHRADWVNWKQVHYVIECKYESDDAKQKIVAAHKKALEKVQNGSISNTFDL